MKSDIIPDSTGPTNTLLLKCSSNQAQTHGIDFKHEALSIRSKTFSQFWLFWKPNQRRRPLQWLHDYRQ